jgi:hypothetical protein
MSAVIAQGGNATDMSQSGLGDSPVVIEPSAKEPGLVYVGTGARGEREKREKREKRERESERARERESERARERQRETETEKRSPALIAACRKLVRESDLMGECRDRWPRGVFSQCHCRFECGLACVREVKLGLYEAGGCVLTPFPFTLYPY